jgi:transposase
MSFHRNAKLGLAGRYALVSAVEQGCSLKAAAAAFSGSPATAHRWWHRWLEASEEARRTLSCLFDRSSRPHRCPRRLAPQLEEAICACRRQTGWGPRLVAGATGFSHSTVLESAQAGWALGRLENTSKHIDERAGRFSAMLARGSVSGCRSAHVRHPDTGWRCFLSTKPVQGMTVTDTNIRHQPTGEENQV